MTTKRETGMSLLLPTRPFFSRISRTREETGVATSGFCAIEKQSCLTSRTRWPAFRTCSGSQHAKQRPPPPRLFDFKCVCSQGLEFFLFLLPSSSSVFSFERVVRNTKPSTEKYAASLLRKSRRSRRDSSNTPGSSRNQTRVLAQAAALTAAPQRTPRGRTSNKRKDSPRREMNQLVVFFIFLF